MALLAKSNVDYSHSSSPYAANEARDWLVAEIPPRQFIGHRSSLSRGSWMGWFDMAVWLKTPAGALQPLQLELVYRDQSGEHRVSIDRCPQGTHRTVLLNAAMALSVNGRVQWAAFVLKQLEPEIQVSLEQWHFVPQERRQRH
ncbi:hypothetical protein [Marinimicrobium sp. C2-29]|uniref:hypothetical protein n=1 Tax=Marinimicrobium sp. C2-29 TaxID=3139825 RepID=UPI0031393CFA